MRIDLVPVAVPVAAPLAPAAQGRPVKLPQSP